MATKQQTQSLDINATISKSEAFINKYKKYIFAGIAAIAFVVVVAFVVNDWQTKREDKAQAQIGLSMRYFMQGTEEGYTKALKGEGQFLGYLKIAENFRMTNGANIARAYAGLCYAQMGQYKEAIAQLEKFSPKGDQTVSPAILACLADCYACDGQADKAIDTFKKAADKADNESLSPVYLMQAAVILESQEKYEDAKKLYEQIKSDYPTSELSRPQGQGNMIASPEIEKYIERATR